MKCANKNWKEFKMVIQETISSSLMYTHAACIAVVGRHNMDMLAKERNIEVLDMIMVSRAFHGIQD